MTISRSIHFSLVGLRPLHQSQAWTKISRGQDNCCGAAIHSAYIYAATNSTREQTAWRTVRRRSSTAVPGTKYLLLKKKTLSCKKEALLTHDTQMGEINLLPFGSLCSSRCISSTPEIPSCSLTWLGVAGTGHRARSPPPRKNAQCSGLCHTTT